MRRTLKAHVAARGKAQQAHATKRTSRTPLLRAAQGRADPAQGT
jgi:hypothetical protein